MSIKYRPAALPWIYLLVLTALPLRAELFSVSASGRITINDTGDTTIPVGTPWTFTVIYDTNAPDLDFELTGMPDPTFGRFTNTSAIPALRFFHYQAGNYQVTLDDPSDFGPFSEIHITFGGTHAIDINLNANSLFPPLAGGPVSFHTDFGDFTHSALTSDALPTNTSLSLANFQDASVSLLPPRGIVLGSIQDMTSFKIEAVPEPSTCGLAVLGLTALVAHRRRR
jgi:MYXO-CTERM domain-containing protein